MSLSEFKDAIVEFDESAIEMADKMESTPIGDILSTISDALAIVGEKYESHEYFLSELMLAGDVAKQVIEKITPRIQESDIKLKGTVVFGTVKGDIHDIGKTIVSSFLIGAGFMVHDIGIEVEDAKFVQAAKKFNADIIAVSALLSTTAPYVPKVVTALRGAGIKAKIIVGGRPITEQMAKDFGADGYGKNPSEAVEICNAWMEEQK